MTSSLGDQSQFLLSSIFITFTLNNRFIHVILDAMTQEEKRKQITTLLNSGISRISKISEDVGMSRLTLYRVKKRFEENGPLKHQKGVGRQSNATVGEYAD